MIADIEGNWKQEFLYQGKNCINYR